MNEDYDQSHNDKIQRPWTKQDNEYKIEEYEHLLGKKSEIGYLGRLSTHCPACDPRLVGIT